MDFSKALALLKVGATVAREGWNGRGMFLYLVPGSTFRVEKGRPMAAHWPVGRAVAYHAHIDLFTPTGMPGGYSVPWLASQTDLLATDWIKVDAAALIPPPEKVRVLRVKPETRSATVKVPKSNTRATPAKPPAPKRSAGQTPAPRSRGSSPSASGAAAKKAAPRTSKAATPTTVTRRAARPGSPSAQATPPGLPGGIGDQGPAGPVPPPGKRIPPGAAVPPSPIPPAVPPADMAGPNSGMPPGD